MFDLYKVFLKADPAGAGRTVAADLGSPVRRVLAAVLLCAGLLAPGAWALSVEQQTTNGRTNPLGIGADDVSFSWAVRGEQRGIVQSAYQIRVGTREGESDVWDSGRVHSDRQIDISLPARLTLLSATRYYWQVKVWDAAGQGGDWSKPAWFETGLLTAQDWAGTQWITGQGYPDWKDYVATLNFAIQDLGLGVLLRASPYGEDGYLYQINLGGATPRLRIQRKSAVGYAPVDDLDLGPLGFSNEQLKQGRHKLECALEGQTITVQLDDKKIDTRRDSTFLKGTLGLCTTGQERAKVYSIKVVASSSGLVLLNVDFREDSNIFMGGTITKSALILKGNMDLAYQPPGTPLLRGTFKMPKEVKSARLHASACGLYQVSINGKKVGDQFFAPGWTSYDKRTQTQTHDVSALLKKGNNAIGVMMGDGWYRGKVGMNWRQVYGDNLAFLCKVRVTYTDGSTEEFRTDESWRSTASPFMLADLQDGEQYDAHLEKPGWDTTACSLSDWDPVTIVDNELTQLVPQPDEPVRVTGVLTAVARTTPAKGEYVYDLGQNMVGVSRIKLTGKAGQTVRIRYGEELYRKGSRIGRLYTDNFRTAKVTDKYTFARNETVVYQPTFTQHGFRYIEITGVDTAPEALDVQGIVLGSDLPDIGDLRLSNPLLDQLVRNIRWGQRSNFLSIPTDTPARDERLGWTGDISVFAPTASRYQDTRSFLGKWMDDIRDNQRFKGNISAIVPQPGGQFDSTGVGWSDAVITVPYAVWRASGDLRIVRKNWDVIQKFYRFVYDSATSDGNLLEEGRSSFFSGDWLSLENVDRLQEHRVIATAYFAENTRMMSEMAAALGDTVQAKEWADLVPKIGAAFAGAYRQADGSIYTGTQTVHAMTLGMNLLADPAQRDQTAASYIKKLTKDNMHLKTGFQGTPWLLPALTRIGRNDLAMQLLLNEDYPSWGFEIKMGATTMWERWNTIREDGEFGPSDMNSFNHYAYGAVGDWMYQHLGGLQILEPGYRKSRIEPLIGYGGLTHAACSIRTPYGLLACSWKLEKSDLVLTATVPANTEAQIIIPAGSAEAVKEGKGPAHSADGVRSSTFKDGRLTLVVGSGTYEFSVSGVP